MSQTNSKLMPFIFLFCSSLLFSSGLKAQCDVVYPDKSKGTQMAGRSSSLSMPTAIKILLVQFKDVKYDSFYTGSSGTEYTFKHTTGVFTEMFNGYSGGQNGDLEPVNGSARDYYKDNSRNQYTLPTATVLNNVSGGYPVWIQLSKNKSMYSYSSFKSEADDSASAAGYNISTPGKTILVYFYAGNVSSRILDRAVLGGNWVITAERRRGPNSYGEQQNDRISHIGYLVHELLHTAGTHHSKAATWDVMHSGHNLGERWSNRPASMHPWLLEKAGWTSITSLNSDVNKNITYSTASSTHSTYYKRDVSTEAFVVENRRYSRMWDQRLPGSYYNDGGILIWRIKSTGLGSNQSSIVPADGVWSESSTQQLANDMWLPNNYPNGKIWDESNPGDLKKDNGSYSYFAITDYWSTGSAINVNFKVNYDVAPSAPQNLTIANPSSDGSHPILQWTANSEPDMNHYKVYRGYTPNWKTTSVTWESSSAASVTGTTWTDNSTLIDLDVLSATYYRITAVDDATHESDFSGSTMTTSGPSWKKAGENITSIPLEFQLKPNYPNPFNPETMIAYDLKSTSNVTIQLLNMNGQAIQTFSFGEQSTGSYELYWDGRDKLGKNLASGVYVCRLSAIPNTGESPFIANRKMTLIR